ncbi:phosphate ABC transporter permease PstA [Microbacterium capsulatum]|uniref:Phosphate transport system permease protein PstA n=1 Tax=Microbacterium capsulatum TaxID=3041921 RepID=A0ABU0XH22_9MICO|nr:phosphate ABC transporter permease PstA [Microbacterium sp. ASV81]MDQ4214411.1 phosphate ABC transporter permease PstA [Microbacterium sp. ASV81]
MTATTTARPVASKTSSSLHAGRLPRYSELYTLLGALAVVAAVFALLAGNGGFNIVGWLIVSAVVYLLAIAVLSAIAEGRRQAVDRVMRGLVASAFVLALIPLVSLLWTVFSQGITTLTPRFIFGAETSGFNWNTLVTTTVAGAGPALVGTLIITGVATVISLPIGMLTAVWLTEYSKPTSPMRRTITFLVDVMTGIPSIVAGLFAFALFALIVGPKAFSGFSAAVALSVLMIPTVVRSSEEMLKLVPMELREASYALGVTKWRTILKVVLRTAVGGLVTSAVLAIARVIGETAPIYIAAGYTNAINTNPFNGPMSTLAVLSYTGYAFPDQSQPDMSHQEAWGSALLLIFIVVILNLVARLIAAKFAPKARR